MWMPLVVTVAVAAAASPQNLSSRVGTAIASPQGGWIAWEVPAVDDLYACCWQRNDSRRPKNSVWSNNDGSDVCSLDSNNLNISNRRKDANFTPSTGGAESLTIYVHGANGQIDRVRSFSSTCEIANTAGRVQDIGAIDGRESIAFLAGFVNGAGEGREGRRKSDGSVSAIAMHESDAADKALEDIASKADSREIRKNAAFWLGNTRGKAGYQALARLRSSDDAAFREHLTFCFSQNDQPEAQRALIDMAKNDAAPRVRGQALFWMAQKAQQKEAASIIRASVDDPDWEVKTKAVFALSQIPNGEGVPDLIRVATENKNREVRKKAMFWLGQSKDPRAIAFFEKILTQ